MTELPEVTGDARLSPKQLRGIPGVGTTVNKEDGAPHHTRDRTGASTLPGLCATTSLHGGEATPGQRPGGCLTAVAVAAGH